MLPFFPHLTQPSPSLFKQIFSVTPSTGYLLLTMLMYRAFCHNSSRFTHPPCPVIYFPFHPSLRAPVRCKNQSPLDFAISRWPPIHPFANFETISPQNHTIKSITIFTARLHSTRPTIPRSRCQHPLPLPREMGEGPPLGGRAPQAAGGQHEEGLQGGPQEERGTAGRGPGEQTTWRQLHVSLARGRCL